MVVLVARRDQGATITWSPGFASRWGWTDASAASRESKPHMSSWNVSGQVSHIDRARLDDAQQFDDVAAAVIDRVVHRGIPDRLSGSRRF